MSTRVWKVRLGEAADADFRSVLEFTRLRFGTKQTLIYRNAILAALDELQNGPDLPGSRARDDLLKGLRSLHMARQGRRGRHLIMYRAETHGTIQVIRILYDGMDLERHIPPRS